MQRHQDGHRGMEARTRETELEWRARCEAEETTNGLKKDGLRKVKTGRPVALEPGRILRKFS